MCLQRKCIIRVHKGTVGRSNISFSIFISSVHMHFRYSSSHNMFPFPSFIAGIPRKYFLFANLIFANLYTLFAPCHSTCNTFIASTFAIAISLSSFFFHSLYVSVHSGSPFCGQILRAYFLSLSATCTLSVHTTYLGLSFISHCSSSHYFFCFCRCPFH